MSAEKVLTTAACLVGALERAIKLHGICRTERRIFDREDTCNFWQALQYRLPLGRAIYPVMQVFAPSRRSRVHVDSLLFRSSEFALNMLFLLWGLRLGHRVRVVCLSPRRRSLPLVLRSHAPEVPCLGFRR